MIHHTFKDSKEPPVLPLIKLATSTPAILNDRYSEETDISLVRRNT